jgi:hypothetical protein
MRKVVIGGVLGAAAFALVALAQPPGQEVLDSVEQYEQGGCVVVEVRFHMPAAYLSHFPLTDATQLRIEVQLLQRPGALPQGQREAARVATAAPFNVRWVEFEAGQRGRGTLFVDFSGATRFAVAQGTDFRSILIGVPAQEGSNACSAERLRARP